MRRFIFIIGSSVAILLLVFQPGEAITPAFRHRAFGASPAFHRGFAQGPFVHAIPGNFSPNTGAFVPRFTGSSMLAARGVFRPTTGTFVNDPLGRFALTTREAFNPRTGTFTPSATGPFVFSTRGDLISSATGNNVPVRHPHHFGFFNPYSPFNPLMQPDPAALSSFNRFLANAGYPAYLHCFNGWNPYFPAGNGYGYGSPYGTPGYSSPAYVPMPYGAYSSGGYSMPISGSGYGAASYASPVSAAPASYGDTPAYTGSSQPPQQPNLAAFGIPNEYGIVKWPVAFRLLPPDQKRDLLDRLEAQLKVITSQGVSGQANPIVVGQAMQTVADLKQWVTGRRDRMAEATYREADRFLENLEKTLRAMRS